ncbi:MAG TPA: DUF3592 domain-containing protein [Elusimicrobiota bacterium]|nr:DUF3592 domain-containing protein [Elusimicrobiota bacterium]
MESGFTRWGIGALLAAVYCFISTVAFVHRAQRAAGVIVELNPIASPSLLRPAGTPHVYRAAAYEIPTVRFTVAGMPLVFEGPAHLHGILREGQAVRVYFNPRRPTEAKLPTYTLWQWSVFWALVSVLLLWVGRHDIP